MVLLDERTGRYFQLNSTGALIMRSLLDGATPRQVADTLTATCDVAAERVAADVEALLTRLAEAGLSASAVAR
ncbi:hypothetical protein BS329_37675 [Amycolatopsis coloradensis]|uniref:HPr-rel-A system PqqD family protein n=2 Tax=Amycolatopsis coloradensis TaxID=76021 RepID=A0A1R0KFQ1_9PSEU|nr:hypothetical protein BS329_37675 [Amycolatopsis coloradensis]